MSKKSEQVDFSEALPEAKLTQILGSTLKCLSESNNYKAFKQCIIPMEAAAASKTDVLQEAATNAGHAVSGAAHAVGDAFKKSVRK
jgi:hypothetical protein